MELSLGWGTIGIFGVEVVFSGAMVAKEAFESIRRVDDMWKFLVAMDMVVFAMMMRVVGSVPAIDIRNADLLNILNLDCFEGSIVCCCCCRRPRCFSDVLYVGLNGLA
jgi:hypothetical protein